ncbi:4-coumarate--CoA ligase 1 [Orussus abietinus]|uniref:4-coumarate--CoA ligase 1 n=1 Tax=Orussus abietinus TaxID=222816 RepID=UPI00062617CC|nr:4-coumarate--CoA ligase 1 [Orussus abietinus]
MKNQTNIIHGPQDVLNLPKDLSLGQLLFEQLRIHGSRVSQVDAITGEELTYEQILDRSIKLAIYLRHEGLVSNDCISICSENNLNFCIPMCAASYLGVTINTLNPLYTESEFQHTLNISKPKIIFVSRVSLKSIQSITKDFSWKPKLILFFKSNDVNLPNIYDIVSNIKDADKNTLQICKIDVTTHVAVILNSSGTSGLPKGVMLTDKNLLAVIKSLGNPSYGFPQNDVVTLGLLPLFHSYAFITSIMKLVIGIKTVLLPRFEEETFLKVIERYRIQYLSLVPPLVLFLAKHPIVDKYDLSSVTTITCGAAPLSQEIQNTVSKRLNLKEIKQGYGLTETTLAVTITPNCKNKPNSIGLLLPGVSAKVIPIDDNDSNTALPPNCKGELCFKGDFIMKGYCGDTSSTAATIDEDGWLHTGDVGYYDEDGYFFIVDRLKELIKYKGFQVPPAELEAILLTHSGIKDAAVIGIPDEEAGELPMAFVVLQPTSKITADDIIKYVNERVSSHKRLRGGVRFVDSIPKAPSGKILRRVLRNQIKSKL